MSKKEINSVRVSPEAVENLEALEAYGFDIPDYEVEEPEDEKIYMESKTMKPETKEIDLEAMFSLKVEETVEEVPVEFSDVEEAMISLLKEKSRELAGYRFFIEGLDEDGVPFGNFNGAGDRAITMYQPDSEKTPDSGRNYGKRFYRWTEGDVKDVLYAIFEQAQVNPLMNEILFSKKEDKAVEEE